MAPHVVGAAGAPAHKGKTGGGDVGLDGGGRGWHLKIIRLGTASRTMDKQKVHGEKGQIFRLPVPERNGIQFWMTFSKVHEYSEPPIFLVVDPILATIMSA